MCTFILEQHAFNLVQLQAMDRQIAMQLRIYIVNWYVQMKDAQ